MDNKEKLMTEEEWLAKYNAGQKKAKKKNVRKWVRNGVALGLVAVLSVAGTLAYLSKKAEKTNTFTGSAGLKLMLTESAWDWDNDNNASDKKHSEYGSTTTNTLQDADYAAEPLLCANPYTPGKTYKKNPQLINWETTTWNNIKKDDDKVVANNEGSSALATTEDVSSYKYKEYVAIRIDLIGHDGTDLDAAITYSKLKNVIEDIVFDTSKWFLIAYKNTGENWTEVTSSNRADCIDGTNFKSTNMDNVISFVFAYGTTADTYGELAQGKATEPLFSQISVKQALKSLDGNKTADQMNAANQAYPTFNLNIKGGAVDSSIYSGATDTQIKTDLLEVLSAKIGTDT